MAAKKKEKKKETQTAREIAPEEETASTESFLNELHEPIWAVITFEKCAAKDLTYPEAEQKMSELAARNISGLCIVSNKVAERLAA